MKPVTLFDKNGSNKDIIDTLGKWKVLECSDLHKLINSKISYLTFKKKIRTLEKAGLIESKFYGNNLKHVFLSNLGIQFTKFDKTYKSSEEELPHDILCGKIVQEILKYSKVIDAKMFHQIKENFLCPDAQMTVFNDDEYLLAIEVELTQKSQSRVKDKIRKYAESDSYDYCIFITNKERIVKTYSRYIGDISDNYKDKFFFIYDCKLSNINADLSNSKCIYKDKLIEISSLLGEKTEGTAGGTTIGSSAPSHFRPNQKTEYFQNFT